MKSYLPDSKICLSNEQLDGTFESCPWGDFKKKCADAVESKLILVLQVDKRTWTWNLDTFKNEKGYVFLEEYHLFSFLKLL